MSGRLNLLAPEVLANPYPLYAELRRSSPVIQVDPDGLYAITRHDDVMFALKNPRLFSSAWGLGAMESNHARLRAVASRALAPGALARLEPRVHAFAQQLADRLPLGRPVDWMESFARPLPGCVIGELFGLEPSLHSRFKPWLDVLTSPRAPGRCSASARPTGMRRAFRTRGA